MKKSPLLLVAVCLWSAVAWGADDPAALQARLQEAVQRQDWSAVKELAGRLEAVSPAKTGTGKPGQPGSPSASAKPSPSPRPDLIKALRDAGFSLSRSPDTAGKGSSIKNGALFSFTDDYRAQSHPVFNTEFYLKWAPEQWGAVWGGYPSWEVEQSTALSAQGKLSSADDSATDALRFRWENQFTVLRHFPWEQPAVPPEGMAFGEHTVVAPQGNPPKVHFDGIVATLSAMNESDRDFNTSRLSAELWATPNVTGLGLGQISRAEPAPSEGIRFRWRPSLGANAGDYLARKGDVPDSTLWLMARLRGDLWLDFLRAALEMEEIVAHVSDTAVYLTEQEETHNYLDAGIDFSLNAVFAVTFQYTIGQDSPKFLDEKIFKGGFSVKF